MWAKGKSRKMADLDLELKIELDRAQLARHTFPTSQKSRTILARACMNTLENE